MRIDRAFAGIRLTTSARATDGIGVAYSLGLCFT
jgi:hypothetical protein